MTAHHDSRLLIVSERVYRSLLLLYPKSFRQTYGQDMVLTFRDCCREALHRSQQGRLTGFWGLVLYDLMITVSTEHIKSWIMACKQLLGLEKEYTFMDRLLNFDVALRTDIGSKRPVNEDNMTSVIPQDTQVLANKGALFIVADGMGGHEKGNVASKMAVDEITAAYYREGSDDIASALKQAVEHANGLIYQGTDEASRGKMGTTCIAAVVQGDSAYVANVGDSRAYLIRQGQIKQISRDHSPVYEEMLAGKITREEARNHPERNKITRCLGISAGVEVDIFTEPVQAGDILVLCTDGLSGLLEDDEIRTIVEQHKPEESVSLLIAQANERGGPDNITAVVARID